MPGWAAVGLSLVTLMLAAEGVEAKPESHHGGRISVLVGESGDIGPSPRLLVMDADGKKVRVRLGWVVHASLSPDGRLIAYNGFGVGGTFLLAADGRGAGRLLIRNARDADWSPSGEAIAFVRGGDLWLRNLGSRSERRLVRNAASPDWSPDGKRLAFDRGSDIWVVETPTGASHRLLGNGSVPRWSPDGRRIAFDRAVGQFCCTYVYVARADGSGQRRLAEGENPAWSPQGREIAFGTFRSVSRIRVDGTQRRMVFAGKNDYCCSYYDLDWAR